MNIFLVGCATAPTTWSKRNITMEQGSKDLVECAEMANLLFEDPRSDGTLAVAALVDARELIDQFESCMKKNGYEKVN